ncbi:HD domain-containing protein [Prochlorococcus sp. MIT 1307]|uniref:HD domain-containing protein n=1 Tax=Prochlorococcus sp. MIT 1307 TaxID=3096219 RepID=UPI002A752AFA|nr:HD domain-containing protein [Prochlorococcus sp. MIT 1307]
MSQRTYHDPLHHGISLDSNNQAEAMVIELIDSAPFQRLRRIRQLGPAFLTFHGAESSRFTHSIGVFHIARKALNRLIGLDSGLKEHKGILYGAALLHDLGHTPLSHTGEEMFGLKHESWTARLIKEHPLIRDPLESYAKGTAIEVADLIEQDHSHYPVLKALVSSQLDCDRLDYLLRDSYSTGTRYGQLDLERILSALTIAPDGNLAIHPKGLMAVEHYLVVRNLMYRSVYNHRINEVCSWLLEQIICTARSLGPQKVWADSYMAKWLWESDKIELDTFLANDDIRTCYHLTRWQEEAPEVLAQACKRILNRNLLKALDVHHLNSESQLELLAKARKMVEKQGENPDYLCTLRHQKLESYQPYKKGLRLWDGEELKALENVSPLVAGLVNPAGAAWLIHPKEIHVELKKEINL